MHEQMLLVGRQDTLHRTGASRQGVPSDLWRPCGFPIRLGQDGERVELPVWVEGHRMGQSSWELEHSDWPVAGLLRTLQ